MQLDRAETGAGCGVEDDKLALAIGQDQVQDQAVWRSRHRLDPRPARDLGGGRRERPVGIHRGAAARHPAGNDRDDDAKPHDKDHAH